VSATTRLDLGAPATKRALKISLEKIGQFCDSRNLPAEVIARVLIVVEELFLNTIKYGYGAECDCEVRITLDADRSCKLIYEDDAPPFDPTEWRARVGPAAADSLREGEAGIDLLFGLAATVSHQALEPGNRLEVTFATK
jgi:anti-sigma regulatory factor (Ser/Thr protein kinase)